MFKALITIVILLLVLIVVFVAVKLVREFTKPKESDFANDSIDKIISDLEIKIEMAELQASRGVETAEQNLQKYKSELKKAKSIKNKLNN